MPEIVCHSESNHVDSPILQLAVSTHAHQKVPGTFGKK